MTPTEQIYKEIEEWLAIRQVAREEKQYKLADMIRKLVEEIYKINICDTKGSVCWTWKNI